MKKKNIDAFDLATGCFFEECKRIEIADLYNDQLNVILDDMLREGRMTQCEANEISEVVSNMVGESERQRFVDGVRYGVQFMSVAMQGIETGNEASNIRHEHMMTNRKAGRVKIPSMAKI